MDLAIGVLALVVAGVALGVGLWQSRRLAAPLPSGEVNALPGQLGALQGEVSSLHGEVSTLGGTLSALHGDVSALRGEVSALHGEVSALHGEVSALQGEVSALRRELDQTQHEVGELKAATEIAPAPPLPKTRPGSLDDLREQLRASHREADETTEE